MMAGKRIRLLQITHDLAIGGLQQVVVNLCKTIDRRQFDIEVLCLRTLGEFVPDVEALGIPVMLLPQKADGPDYLAFRKVARILRDRRIDVIHTHNTQPLVDGVIGGLLAGVKTMIHTDHARHFPDKRRYMFAEWLLSHFVYRMVGVSEHTAANLVRYEHIAPRRIVTIPNGIVDDLFVRPVDIARKRNELGIDAEGPVIGLGVRLTEQKGITYLLQALPELLRAHPRLTLVIAGDGAKEAELRQEARALGVDARVRFIGPRTDMYEVIQTFDIYVLPSIWEGLPMVLLEAMAASRPIVATDVGGNATAVKHDVNGILVPPREPASLATTIDALLRDAGRARRYGASGRALFEQEFSAQQMARRYEALYRREL